MAVARASSGPRLLSWSLTSLRCAYSTTTTSSSSTSTPSPPPRTGKPNLSSRDPSNRGTRKSSPENADQPRRKGLEGPPAARNPQLDNPKAQTNFYIPAQAKFFVQPNGRLRTTPDVWQFLHETGIEYNNSKALRIWLGPEHRRITDNFSCSVQYSPEYILHPYHLQYLTPHQHPLTPAIMAQYRQKLVDEQLWIYTMNRGGFVGVVKGITQRRLTWALASALEELGHPGTGIRGTVIVTLGDVLKAAHSPAHLFGQGVAQAIDREWKQYLWRRKSEPVKSARAHRFG
ncbi:hypothetical protein NCS57_00423500 [Fusarium keratoplasticum]|uniref:Uncharacterized protein n=1 Tax=Fusarium keratoplasticum TaxID=1328300 RepID=A0ACC0R677_9HYPO|nr:hypothetical protein NCS57_00423500 [Fusarium keratoplasticum]KAI8675232.1 hypothetical protein NCS57_00423500 [Fusarium keratoplasticum]